MLKVQVAKAGELDDPSGSKSSAGILEVTEYMPPDLFCRDEGHIPWAVEQAELVDGFLANTLPAFVYDQLAMIMARFAMNEGLLEDENEL